MIKIYCAGPLFTAKERQEMDEIAGALEAVGFATFLPQRDGLELTKYIESLVKNGFVQREASQLMSRAIFALDIYQVLHGCNALVANLNGRVPDEGTVSEASMAWSCGKVVVGYKADSRTVFEGEDNPLVAGLFAFHLCNTIDELVSAVQEQMRSSNSYRQKCINFGSVITSALEKKHCFKEIMAEWRNWQTHGT